MFLVSVYQRTVGDNIFWSAGSSGGTASRYVLVPALLLTRRLCRPRRRTLLRERRGRGRTLVGGRDALPC